MSLTGFRYEEGGVHLPELGLWLDAPQARPGPERVFVSHAHADHTARHQEVILTKPTARLMQARLGGERIEHVLPFGQTAEFGGGSTPFKLTLLPAGHVFGSAMALVEAGGESLLYTGDFKLRPGLSAEACDPARAAGVDVLIMETTYGRPVYQFPPAEEVLRGIVQFCRDALVNDETPVLFGYSLGKSQELLRGLAGADLPVMLHGSVFKLTRIYEEFGVQFPAYERYDPEQARGRVLVFPVGGVGAAMLRKLGPVRTAVTTGWAVDPGCRYRYRVDAAFPLSDHADFPGLIELVHRVKPAKVYTLHGFAADFAQSLRDRGHDAQALSEEDQLALPLAFGGWIAGKKARRRSAKPPLVMNSASREPAPNETVNAPPADANAAEARADDPTQAAPSPFMFATFAALCGRIAATSRKTEKTRLLGEYFSRLEPSILERIAPWFTGHPFAPVENKPLQLGWALIRDALCEVAALEPAEFGQIYLTHSDLGETAREILARLAEPQPTLSLETVGEGFARLHAARGSTGKQPLLAGLLRRCVPLEGKYLIKILTGDLRIGLKEGLVEEAIADAFATPLAAVKKAGLLVGHIGETAALAARQQLDAAALVPFRPVKFMLASPEDSAERIWARVAEWRHASSAPDDEALFPAAELAAAAQTTPLAWLEDKYDGIRCQLHKVGRRVALFSRDLREITASFLEIGDALQPHPGDFVIDGEIVALRGEQVLPFGELQRRLGRRESDLFLAGEIPVRFIAFDLLWHEGRNLLDEPLSVRRDALESVLPPCLLLARVSRALFGEEVAAAFAAARARGHEGLVVKDPASVYSPGRRGLAWLKLKQAQATLDCVVIGAEYGHGRRKEVLSDYTFAVRDETSGELKTIGKAYSGLTDAEIAALTRHFLGRVRSRRGRYHEVEPDTVLEIAFDSIQASPRHASGLALRFPRIARIRADKTVRDIDTVETARRLVCPSGTRKPESIP